MPTDGVWTALAVPYLAAAVLLVVSGAPKVRDPQPLANALRSAGLPSSRALARGAAGAEVVVGLGALAVPSRAGGMAVAVAYAAFTAFVVLALVRGGVLESCGCFGKADTPPSVLHAAVTALAALAGAGVALWPPASGWTGLDGGGVLAVAAPTALVTFLAWQVLAVLPTVTPASVRSATRS